MGYFDIEDILATSTPLAASFTMKTSNLGFLINQPQSTEILPNESILLPFWLVEHLAPEVLNPESLEPNSTETPIPIISISIPDYLSKRALNFYKASPTFAVLSGAGMSVSSQSRMGGGSSSGGGVTGVGEGGFYDAIYLWCSVMDDSLVRDIVSDMLVARICKIWDLSTGSMSSLRDNVQFEAGLDSWERFVWKQCSLERSRLKKWENNPLNTSIKH